jgi:hypothetical protein
MWPASARHPEMSVFILAPIREMAMYFAALMARGELKARSYSQKTKLFYRSTWGFLSPAEDFDFRDWAEL